MFEIVAKQLLQGEFICEYKYPSSFHYLQNPDHFEKVDGFLKQLNYQLMHTQQKSAFFVAYQSIDNSARNEIRRVFQQFRSELHPVVEWLELMMQVLHQDTALMPGDALYFAKLLQTIEQNTSLAERIHSFAKFKGFNSTDNSLKTRLEKLLKTLEEWGYLVLKNPDTLIYQVTGKLEYFYQALEFIREHEQIPIEQTEEDTAQESLL